MPFPDNASALCFGVRTRTAARAVTRAYNDRLRPLDLRITQVVLMNAIARSPSLTLQALADLVDIEPSALSRNLRILERRGLIAGDGGRGRGGRRCRLTAAGQAALEAAVPVWDRAQDDLARALPGPAQETRAVLIALEAAAVSMISGAAS